MKFHRLTRADLSGRVIDAHSHAGVALATYAAGAYPYAQTIEGLHGQQLHGGVDLNVVFPFTADLYFDLPRMLAGRHVKARRPLSGVPYQAENTLLLREVFEYCPEIADRFLPFAGADPAREAPAQVKALAALMRRYPVYGLKINPAICQSPVRALLDRGRPILDFARRHNLPILLHTTSVAQDAFSYAGDAFRVIDANPDLRFCLAHCILFSRPFLDRALATPNVWVDTAAFTIQVQLCRDLTGTLVQRKELIDADFGRAKDVFAVMCAQYSRRLVWGTDSPAYAYICRRKLNARTWQHFHYKAAYMDEIRFLRACPPAMRRTIAGRNTVNLLLGSATAASGMTRMALT